ncbi:MAG: hypothetical protein ACI4TZ_03275 [Christensenellales bacterium]
MQELHNTECGWCLNFKRKSCCDVLEYYNNELKQQDIYKSITSLYEQQKISEQTKVELFQAVERYKICIIELLSKCKELHVRLYDNTYKNYKLQNYAFYRGVEQKD